MNDSERLWSAPRRESEHRQRRLRPRSNRPYSYSGTHNFDEAVSSAAPTQGKASYVSTETCRRAARTTKCPLWVAHITLPHKKAGPIVDQVRFARPGLLRRGTFNRADELCGC